MMRDALARWSAAFYAKGRPGYMSGLVDFLEVVADSDGRLFTNPSDRVWGELLTPPGCSTTVVLWTVADGGRVGPHSHSVTETVRLLNQGEGTVWIDGNPTVITDKSDPLVVPARSVHEARYVGRAGNEFVRVLIDYAAPGLKVKARR